MKITKQQIKKMVKESLQSYLETYSEKMPYRDILTGYCQDMHKKLYQEELPEEELVPMSTHELKRLAEEYEEEAQEQGIVSEGKFAEYILKNKLGNLFEDMVGGTGGLSPISGGPVLAEEEGSGDKEEGYAIAMDEVSTTLEKLASKIEDRKIANMIMNLSRSFKGQSVKANAKSFRLKKSPLNEMYNLEAEEFYKKLDNISNDIGKQKLIFEWVKTGRVNFKTYLSLIEYVQQDMNI